MKPHLPALLSGLMLSVGAVTPAAAYPVDCAILLCLAGGWPASAECAHARAVFIRRITPWPIEPPLQIWNCPMRLGARSGTQPVARVFKIADAHERMPVVPPGLQLVQGSADVDISDLAFDFVRSIRVFHIENAYQRWNGGDDDICIQYQSVRLGSYGAQGDFNWQRSNVAALPPAFEGLRGWSEPDASDEQRQCPRVQLRAVFVEWRDHQGGYGFEQVNY